MRFVRVICDWRGASKTRLPLARKVVTFSKPVLSRQVVSCSRLARRPPTLMAGRKATWRGMGGSYSRPRGAAVALRGIEIQLIAGREEADVGLAAAGDEDLVARGRPLRVPAEETSKIVGANNLGACPDLRSGADGTRTRGLRRATAALSQLSYSPRKQIFVRKV